MYNSICHIELEVTDLNRSRAFYEGLFGWKFADFAIPDMMIFGQGDTHLGGLMRVDEVHAGRSPSIWFRVEDLDGMVARAQELGGSVVSPRSPVPNVGWSACVGDPDGNPVGLVEYSENRT